MKNEIKIKTDNNSVDKQKSVFDPNYQAVNLDSKIVVALERITASFRVELWRKNKETSLSPIQMQILIFLLFHKTELRTVSAIADEFNVTKATVSAAISSLEDKKLVEKLVSNNDQRIVPISLTEKGMEIAQKVSLFSDGIRTQIEILPDEKKKIFYEILFDTINRMQQANIISINRMCHCCKYFASDKNGKLFCNLLQKPLASHELRIDCPDYSSIH